MKKIKILLFILLTLPVHSQWLNQNSGTVQNLNDVYSITEDVVVIVGDKGIILKTTNGGENWVQKTSGTTQGLLKVQFVSSNIGFAVGSNGTLLKTADGGENWNTISTAMSTTFSGLSCLNENNLFISGGMIEIKKSSNAGISFSNTNPPSNVFIKNIQFINEQIGFAQVGGLYKTTDGGVNWTLLFNDTNSFFFLNENVGFVNNYYNNGLFKTINGGATFEYIGYPPNNTFQVNDFFSLNHNTLWGVGFNPTLCGCPNFSITKTEFDIAGNSYQTIKSDFTTNPLNAIYFANANVGYVVGSVGQIYKNTTAINTVLGINKIDQNLNFNIYPNPSADFIDISFNSEITDDLTVVIYNEIGMICRTEKLDYNKSKIDIKDLARGVYFVKINIDKQTVTKKFLKI